MGLSPGTVSVVVSVAPTFAWYWTSLVCGMHLYLKIPRGWTMVLASQVIALLATYDLLLLPVWFAR